MECRRTLWQQHGPLIDYEHTTGIGQILPPCWSGTRSLFPAWLWNFLRGCRLPGVVSWPRALACTWIGTGVAGTRPPLHTILPDFKKNCPKKFVQFCPISKILFAHVSTSNCFWCVCVYRITIITENNLIVLLFDHHHKYSTITVQYARKLLLSQNFL